ncbi:putative isomerase YbhE [Xylaria sp. CBS 124048]|nr:putative isomerase YbhE [Xylaria sp. CBS 124048]
MSFKTLTSLLALGSLATAAPSTMQQRSASAIRKLIVGGPNQILTADFNGTFFQITGSNVTLGATPSWLRYQAKTNTLYAVNENGANIGIYTLNNATKSDPTFVSDAAASSGVVFLEFNKDQTRMVGAGYGSGMVDVWNIEDAQSPKLLKQITVNGTLGPNQTGHHPHQALLEPTGRYMIVNDLGGDQLLVLDTQDDRFEITSTVPLFAGAGPRHGGFLHSADGTQIYYAVACEVSSKVILFALDYSNASTLQFKHISTQSTYGAAFPPSNTTTAAAGALAVASNNRDVYITNRLTGNATDSISHFIFDASSPGLTFASAVSSRGIQPRQVSFSDDESLLFVANQGGEFGLVALSRDAESGTLDEAPVAVKPLSEVVAPGLDGQQFPGPEYVHQVN